MKAIVIMMLMSLSQSTKTNTKNAIGKKQVFAKLITLMQSHVLVMDTKSLMKIVAMVMFPILYQVTKMRMHVYCGENPL